MGSLSVADRATLGNMSPEYGATIGFFPVDEQTLEYLRLTGRAERQVRLIEAYCKAQGLFRTADSPDPIFTDTLELDLEHGRAEHGRTAPSAGPRAPARLRRASSAASWPRRWSITRVSTLTGSANG